MTSPQSEKLRTRTLRVRRGLGQSLNKPEKTPVPHQRFGCFLQVVYTLALLASYFSDIFCDTLDLLPFFLNAASGATVVIAVSYTHLTLPTN